MSTEAASPSGPVTLDEAVEALMPDSQEHPEAETEEVQETEPVESTEEASAEPEEAESEEVEAEDESEEPQHLDVGEYGDLTMTAKVNGEERRVSLADLVKGYQQEADFTRKSQALAEERKAFESEQASIREQFTQQQEMLAQHLAAELGAPPDPSMATEDPLGYIEAEAQYKQKAAKVQELQQQANVARMQELANRAKAETSVLIEKDPEFGDAGKVKEFVSDVAESFGFTEQEVVSSIDHRIILMAKDALKWRASQKADPKVEKAIAKPRKVLKPGTSKTSREIEAQKRAAANRKLNRKGGVSIDEYLEAKFAG